MAIITLTTDLGEKDFYAGAVKGQILHRLPQAHVVDITHQIRPFDIFQAAYVLGQAWQNFPAGTVHLVNVESSDPTFDRILLLEYKGHHFIGYDNGWFSLAVHDIPENAYAISLGQLSAYTFLLRDVMVPVACSLMQKTPAHQLGAPLRQIKERVQIEAQAADQSIRGYVIYIDHYGNAVTNIHRKLFEEVRQGRQYRISFRREVIQHIAARYHEVSEGEVVVVFNSAGYLEVAINKGHAAQLLGLDINLFIQIDFQA